LRDTFQMTILRLFSTLVLFPSVLLLIGRPLLSYKQALLVSLAGCAGFAGLGAISRYWRFGGLGVGNISAWAVAITWSMMSCILINLVLLCVAIRRRYWPRFDRHQCQKCGYDLRGTSTGVCSECGSPQPIAQRAAKFQTTISGE
jgi:hypothetical protein